MKSYVTAADQSIVGKIILFIRPTYQYSGKKWANFQLNSDFKQKLVCFSNSHLLSYNFFIQNALQISLGQHT